MTLTQIARMDEDEARAYWESIRWPDGPVCPHCGSTNVTRLKGEAHRAGVLNCKSCRRQFTVTVNSIMEDSHVPLNKWVLAFHLLCSSKKGFSSLQLQRELELGSYRTALFMTHRIREAMSDTLSEALKGTVEADETYIGGKPRKGDGKEHKHGRGTSKTVVLAAVEREGGAEAAPVARVTHESVTSFLAENVDSTSTLVTDEYNIYERPGRMFSGGHETVNHAEDQYVRRTPNLVAHTNTAESFFSLMKRGHYGVYHKMSKQHMHRYCNEFSFRWDHRKVSDSHRTVCALSGAAGKRLTYGRMTGRA